MFNPNFRGCSVTQLVKPKKNPKENVFMGENMNGTLKVGILFLNKSKQCQKDKMTN